eukprot:1450524-Pyramimonas_sp.AAC.1
MAPSAAAPCLGVWVHAAFHAPGNPVALRCCAPRGAFDAGCTFISLGAAPRICLLYTSDAADDTPCVDL